MKPLGLPITALARELKVPVGRLSEIVNGQRALNADAALRLSRYFGNSPEFWINLQAAYDLRVTIHSSVKQREPADSQTRISLQESSLLSRSPLQRGAVPARETCACFVGSLAEIHQRLFG